MDQLTHTLTEVGTEGGMLKIEGQVGEGAIIRVNGQTGSFSHVEGSFSWFSIPPLDFDEDEVAAPIRVNNRNRNFIRLFRKKDYDFMYLSDTGTDGELAFDRKWKDRYYSGAEQCYVGIKLEAESALMELKAIKLVVPNEKNGLKP